MTTFIVVHLLETTPTGRYYWTMRTSNRWALRVGLSLSLLAIVVQAPASPTASANPLAGIPAGYNDYDELPACSDAVTSFCVESFTIDLDGDGTFTEPPAGQYIEFAAWLFSIAEWNTPGLSYEVRVGGSQELHPTVPEGTASQFVINTGQFRPTPNLFTQAEILAFNVENVNGNWITSGTWKTTARTFATPSESNGEETFENNKRDYLSQAQGVQFYDPVTRLNESKRGMWVSTNASSTGELVYNPSNMTWTVELGGPVTTAAGNQNVLRYSIFLPDTFIRYAYGTTPDVLRNALTMTRTDKDVTTQVTATMTRVEAPVAGLVLTLPDIRLFGTPVTSQSVRAAASRFTTQPTIKIRPKKGLLRAPVLVSARKATATSVRVIGRAVPKAKRYQAMCNKGLTVKVATGRTPTVRVKGLTKGRWTCKIRAREQVGGKWSKTMKVTLR